MPVLKKDELIERISSAFTAEDGPDLSALDDLRDTVDDYESRLIEEKEAGDARVTAKDNEWRKRYVDRFMGGDGAPPEQDEETQTPEDNAEGVTYEDIFE